MNSYQEKSNKVVKGRIYQRWVAIIAKIQKKRKSFDFKQTFIASSELWGIKLNQTWVENGVYKNCINDTLDYLQ